MARQTLDIKQAAFFVPELDDLVAAIGSSLQVNYAESSISVEPCPDLRQFGCAQQGLRGDPTLIEIGGEPYVHNPQYRDEGSFDLHAIAKAAGMAGSKLIGAGFPSLVATKGKCGELMPCQDLSGDCLSKLARVGAVGEPLLEAYPSSLHGGLGNIYASQGLAGDVIRITARRRIGDEGSLSQIIRRGLAELTENGRKHTGMGGVFRVLKGKVRAHISPDFECIPFDYYDTERNEVTRPDFLKFYDDMGPDLTCMSVLWTGDPENGALHLRPTGEHTHFFSTSGKRHGGHYHFDTTPDIIAYEGYFYPAARVIRVNDIYERLSQANGE